MGAIYDELGEQIRTGDQPLREIGPLEDLGIEIGDISEKRGGIKRDRKGEEDRV